MQLTRQLVKTFIGREKEVDQVVDALSHARLVTVVGMGGIGKTQLALRVMDTLTNAVFIPLESVFSPELLPTAIIRELNPALSEDQLLDYLSQTDTLLILDNFEHLLDSARFLETILEATEVRLLVTSREPLHLKDEAIMDLHGLNVMDAVQLFRHKATQVRANFQADDVEIEAICRYLEGMPLGIELAASWARLLTCKEIYQHLQQGLDLLESNMLNSAERHYSMRGVLAATWDYLTADEQQALSHLALFESDFTQDAAVNVAQTSLNILLSVVDKSLLRVGDDYRMSLHPLLRQFAAERLPQSQDRFAEYYAHFLDERKSQSEHLEQIALELDNILAAWYWSADHQRADLIDLMQPGLSYFYTTRGYYHEAVTVFHHAAQNLQPDATLARSLYYLGYYQYSAGQYDTAQHTLERGFSIADAHGDLSTAAQCLNHKAAVTFMRADYAASDQAARRALALNGQVGNQLGMIQSYKVLAGIAAHEGRSLEAIDYYEACIVILRRMDHPFGLGTTLTNLATEQMHILRFRAAQRSLEEAITLFESVQSKKGMVQALAELAASKLHLNESLEEAEAHAQQALTLSQEISFKMGEMHLNGVLGHVAFKREDYPLAIDYFQKRLNLLQIMGQDHFIADGMIWRGRAALKNGERAESWSDFAKALQLATEKNLLQTILDALCSMAWWLNETQPHVALALMSIALHHPTPTPLIKQVYRESLGDFDDAEHITTWTQARELVITHRNAIHEFVDSSVLDDLIQTIDAHFGVVKDAPLDPLTERELEVLKCLNEGMNNNQIADLLIISIGTVKRHNYSIFSKLGVQNRTQAVLRARELNLIQ